MPNGLGTLASLGVGTGMKIQELVDQLIEREGEAKAEMLNRQEAVAETKLSGYGKLKSRLAKFKDSLEPLQDPKKFQAKKVCVGNDPTLSSDAKYLEVKAESSVKPGSFSIQIAQLAKADTYAITPYPVNTVFNTGTLAITIGAGQLNAQTVSILIDTSNNTLQGMANAINATAGLSANIINSSAGTQLLISGQQTGIANAISIAVTQEDPGTAESLTTAFTTNLSHPVTATAQDAQVTINGQLITSPSNKLENTIAGVTIDLLAQPPLPTNTFTLKIVPDVEQATKYIKDFVAAYNKFSEHMHELTKTDIKVFGQKGNPKDTKVRDETHHKDDVHDKDKAHKRDNDGSVQTKTKHGELYNDPLARQILDDIRNALASGSTVATLAGALCLQNIGVVADRSSTTDHKRIGKLKVDEDQLKRALENDIDAVGYMLNNKTNGAAVSLHNTIDVYLNGAMTTNTSNKSLIKQAEFVQAKKLQTIEMEKFKLAEKLKRMELMYIKQFSEMDQVVGKLQKSQEQMVKEIRSGFVKPGLFNN